jgi:predicted O-methyltransferase YrrM
MRQLPEPKNDWLALGQLIGSGARHKIFVSALKMRIFDHLSWSAPEDIAGRLKSDARNTELFLNALAGMGLILKKDGRYGHTERSAEFLASSSPNYLGDFLLHMNSFHEQFPVSIEDLVRKGPPPPSGLDMGDASMWAESARLSAAYQYGGEAQHIARIVSRLPEFAGMRRMLDLGGGSGFFTMAIVSAHPSMQGVVFEQPAVAKVVRDFIREYEVEDRVTAMEGDFTKDDLGGPYDLVFASASLNFVKSQLDALFSRIYDALAPGGIFMTHQDGIKGERTKPVNHITEFLVPEMMGTDFAIAQGEIAEAMLRSGFQSVRSFTKHSSMGEMDVDIGRKTK